MNAPEVTSKSSVQSNEVSYELHTLGWKAFQDLCVCVTAEILGQTVQVFLPTHDAGRDGAFHGQWKQASGEAASGSFTVQCKFSAKKDKKLRLADISDEIAKAKSLAAKNLATTYLLMTNASLSATAESEIREAFMREAGVKHFFAFGGEWLSQKIRESPRLRMLVPRVYGLGDLSQILDDRAYAQAKQILSSMGDDLNKFVITEAFDKSAKALLKHGFVLLLGEPASGKSTIAAALSVGALDVWGCSTLKICGAGDFVTHWNPHEPRQFFWVDDAFGATQYDASSAAEWNRVFSHMEAAIKRGARVLFTSRDYIYKAARCRLKEGAFPLLIESQVVIDVGKLSKVEKEQILYNHIRLGTQSPDYRRRLKPHLPAISEHYKFLPEIARRLGNPMFTQKMGLTEAGLKKFVESPLEFLLSVLRGLDNSSRAAIALIFMRAGRLSSPISLSTDEVHTIELLGGSLAGVREALNALDGTLVKRTLDGDSYSWEFKHPTIRDAFASLIAEDPELLDIYLAGTPAEKLVHEVSCGPTDIEGIKVVIPTGRFQKAMERLGAIAEKDSLIWFLTYRCNKDFLVFYLKQKPQFYQRLRRWGAYMDAFTEVRLIARLHGYGLLPETERNAFVEKVYEILKTTLDDGFLDESVRNIFRPEEFKKALALIRTFVTKHLGGEIDETKFNYSPKSDDSPDTHFENLTSTLWNLEVEFKDDQNVVDAIGQGLQRIKEAIDDLEEQAYVSDDDYAEMAARGRISEGSKGRSIFDDVDE